MDKDFGEVINEFKAESREKFFELFRAYGATEEMIEVVKTKLPNMPENYYESNIENKLALLNAVGVTIDKICEHPQFLKAPMKKFLLKCEIAILEDCFVDVKLLQTIDHKELVANFGARERGYLPKDRNIFYGFREAAKMSRLGMRTYMDRFYSMKTFTRIHDRFRDEFPEFYEIFCGFQEFKSLCVHSKNKYSNRKTATLVEKSERGIKEVAKEIDDNVDEKGEILIERTIKQQ